jgi:serine-type D-Ala-D-Ala carboxypeptidase/endopeptidase (penicillin-binding protein 4)
MRTTFLLTTLFLLSSCAALRKTAFTKYHKTEESIKQSPVFSRAFTGFMLSDPTNGKILCNVNGDQYFTPASNTKIQTLHTSLHVLGDSMPGLQYYSNKDFMVLRGTGDPTLGHPKFTYWQQNLAFLNKNNKKTLQINQDNWKDLALGPGWCWDDASEAYSPERSAMPFHGNVFNVSYDSKNSKVLKVAPPGFEWTNVDAKDADFDVKLLMEDEQYIVQQGKSNFSSDFQVNIPIKNVESLYFPLLLKAIGNPPIDLEGMAPTPKASDWKTLKSCPIDTVYRLMMHQSDNFIAEQLLLVCAGQKTGQLEESKIIKWTMDSLYTSMAQKPKWVDGSGLSRYNMNTPRNYIEILKKLWEEQSRERLFDLFPAGGVSGTLKNWYGDEKKPYIFAKSGSMTGVYCLSGYLVCQSGKVLTFSFLNNNIPGSINDWKMEIQKTLHKIKMEN